MVDDFVAGVSRTNEEATQSAIVLAMKKHKVTDIENVEGWNKGGNPLNLGKKVPINSIEDLYEALSKGYPLYAGYGAYIDGRARGHGIVVTGVSLTTGLVYTNNPWGIRGVQTFEEFITSLYKDSRYKFATCYYLNY